MAMKVIVVLLLALTSCVSAADVNRRMRRDIYVEWLLSNDGNTMTGNNKESGQSQKEKVEDMTTSNKTPKSRCSIEGVWYNHLGSEMIINSTSKDGVLSGEYRTAVERKKGTAGQTESKLIGHTSYNGAHTTFGLTVVWRNGLSVTSWTGQCHVCGGEEKLMTTWILTSEMDNCDDYWMANRIGQDTFTRTEIRDGPRREDNIHTPEDFARHLEEEEFEDQLDL